MPRALSNAEIMRAGFEALRLPGDPTGILTKQMLRYNVGQPHRVRPLPFYGRNSGRDARIRTALYNAGQRATINWSRVPRAYLTRNQAAAMGRHMRGTPAKAGQQRSLFRELYDQFQKAKDEAKKANEERYKQLLEGYQQRYDRGMATLNDIGTQREADIRQDYTNRQAQMLAGLAGRGLTGSTTMDVMARGNVRAQEADLNRWKSQMAQLRLGTDAQLSADRLGVIERRTDTYPSDQSLISLAQMLAAEQERKRLEQQQQRQQYQRQQYQQQQYRQQPAGMRLAFRNPFISNRLFTQQPFMMRAMLPLTAHMNLGQTISERRGITRQQRLETIAEARRWFNRGKKK